MERKSSLEQMAPLSGIAFAVLGVAGVAIALPGSPDFVGPGDEYVRYYTQHDNDIIIGSIGLLLATFALVWFLGSVRRHLAQAEGGDGRLSNVAFAGGAIGAAMLLGSTVARLAPALRVDDQGTITRDVAVTMGDLADILWGVAAPLGLGVLLAATAVVGLRYAGRGVPRWLAWTSAALAVPLVVPFVSWVAIMVVPLWAVAMSLIIYRQEVGVPELKAAPEPSPAAVAT